MPRRGMLRAKIREKVLTNSRNKLTTRRTSMANFHKGTFPPINRPGSFRIIFLISPYFFFSFFLSFLFR
ncbi:hypothetical protein PUN28_018079 [Cardiocondyla obscurior]|uniref:Uncharacterized protein n=1 Tax=Cardiocondyla obscurior TaxID=286306 RepID=A0AAW2EJW8_9HYME